MRDVSTRIFFCNFRLAKSLIGGCSDVSSHAIRFIGLGEGNDEGPIQMDIYIYILPRYVIHPWKK